MLPPALTFSPPSRDMLESFCLLPGKVGLQFSTCSTVPVFLVFFFFWIDSRLWVLVVVGREETRTAERGRGKACISLWMKNRVEFGEYVAVLGSSEEMGGWERKVPTRWTEEGWVAELEIEKEERVEYKFVIVGGDGKLIWEGRGHRVRELEKGGRFVMVCHWNETGETGNVVELDVVDEDEEEEEEGVDGVDDASAAAETSSVSEVALSPFVQDWQGREGSQVYEVE